MVPEAKILLILFPTASTIDPAGTVITSIATIPIMKITDPVRPILPSELIIKQNVLKKRSKPTAKTKSCKVTVIYLYGTVTVTCVTVILLMTAMLTFVDHRLPTTTLSVHRRNATTKPDPIAYSVSVRMLSNTALLKFTFTAVMPNNKFPSNKHEGTPKQSNT